MFCHRLCALALGLVFGLGGLLADTAQVVLPREDHSGAGRVLYFALTDRFENGSTANDSGGLSGGASVTGLDPTSPNYFHGGDFTGLTARLDYLKNLGVEAIWVTPPFRNRPVQGGSAGYHGYWITDFLNIDPHLGGNEDFKAFVSAAQAKGLKVYLDIIVNHSADVIRYSGGGTSYRSLFQYPYKDSAGASFDPITLAWNGLGDASAFPKLSATTSFPYQPTVDPADREVKNPAWLNDLTLYHNRGDSTFSGENSTFGDFVGLDDLFTEHPAVVNGFIDVYTAWMKDHGVDGYRIDTVKHVNIEFWQAFAPALRRQARALGRPDFVAFGEVYQGDPVFVSCFQTVGTLDASLDFPLFFALRDYVSRAQGSSRMAQILNEDDRYTRHDGNVHLLPTFLGNHDAGRFGYFLKQDNFNATDGQLLSLMQFGHGLLYLLRGQPVVYYGDEQGLSGTGGDSGARDDLFATQVNAFKGIKSIGSNRTGAEPKFDADHPLYVFLSRLAALRKDSPALRHGAQLLRETNDTRVFAFSRIERAEQVEYLVAFNNSRSQTAALSLQTSQPQGGALARVFDSRTPLDPGVEQLVANSIGKVSVSLAPLQFSVWKAASPLPPPASLAVAVTSPAAGASLSFPAFTTDGQTFPVRQELRAELTGNDGFAEVTFAMERASRPGQYEILGVDDAAPYRILWAPPADLPAGETFRLLVTADDLRGHRATAELGGLKVAAGGRTWGVRGSEVPRFVEFPVAALALNKDSVSALAAQVKGSEPLQYQWYRDGKPLAGATGPVLRLEGAAAGTAGRYFLLARNQAGTTVCGESVVTVSDKTGPDENLRPKSALVNISSRTPVGGQSEVQIAGFVIGGNGPKQLLLRGCGPSLAAFGVAGALPDPRLRLYDASSSLVGSQQGWDPSLSAVFDQVGAYAFPAGSKDSAMVVTVNPGIYSVMVDSPSDTRGVALVEVYEVGRPTSFLRNISTRSPVGVDSAVQVAGFVIEGTEPKHVLIRAAGPSLEAFGVPGVLKDPVLTLYDSANVQLLSNDDWSAAHSAEFAAASAFAWMPGSADSSIVTTLAPGRYTAIVQGKNRSTGIALVEVYELP